MTVRYLYIKFTGLLLVIVGLSYAITSLYNLFGYLYGDIIVNNGNTVLMILGLIIPFFIFIFGVFFFVYYDNDVTKVNKLILALSISVIVMGLLIIILKSNYLVKNHFGIAQIVYFLHPSMGYSSLIVGIMSLVATIKYKL